MEDLSWKAIARSPLSTGCPCLEGGGGSLKIMAMIDSLNSLRGLSLFLCHLIKEPPGDAGLTFTKAEVTQCIFEHHEKLHRGCGKVNRLIMNGTSYKIPLRGIGAGGGPPLPENDDIIIRRLGRLRYNLRGKKNMTGEGVIGETKTHRKFVIYMSKYLFTF